MSDPLPPRTEAPPIAPRALSLREVVAGWTPLAASWLLMGLELPAVSAVMARLPHATVSLAAYGGVVFPAALIIESPIIMLLAATTALARDLASYRLVRRFMFVVAGSLLALHALIAFTPLFDVLAVRVLAVPAEVREPARIGLRLMLPWVISIAFRRTAQGLLIRSGRPRAVTVGTLVRLGAESLVLAAGLIHGRIDGIVVGTAAIACGVLAEAIVAGITVRPAVRELRDAAVVQPPLTLRAFLAFYLPLMATPFIQFLTMPLGSAAMSRMPRALDSLATWPVLSGATFTMRSLGFAFNEVMVSQLDQPRPLPALSSFARRLSIGSSALLALVAATPLGLAWFARISALPPELTGLATREMWWLVLAPAAAVGQSYWQGALVWGRETRAVTESVLVSLGATAVVLIAGWRLQSGPGLAYAAAGLTVGGVAQCAWLAWRARQVLARVRARDAG